MENGLYIEAKVYGERIDGIATGKLIAVMTMFGIPVVWGKPSEDEREAMSSLRRALRRALECNHEMEFVGHKFAEGQNGNSYTVAMYECKHCGYCDNIEVDDFPF